ncbi:MAG: hypothetical protein J6Y77_06720 [Paludibacteraceae bacterium]|nr:hypothetical protein [Paludibacteraceae bacterium]
MKTFLKIILWTFVATVLLVVGVIAAAVSRPGLKYLIREIAPLYVNAQVQVSNLDYHIFKTWPQVEVELHDLLILSQALEPTDTLVYVPYLQVKADADTYLHDNKALVWGLLDRPMVKAVQGREKANWDIAYPSEPDTAATTTALPDIYLEQLEIRQARLSYLDSTDLKHANIDSLDLQVSGAYLADSVYAQLQLLLGRLLYEDPSIDRHYRIRQFGLEAKAMQNRQVVDINLQAGTDLVCLDDSLLGIRERLLDIRLDAYSNHRFDSLCVRDLEARLDSIRLSADGLVDLRDTAAIGMDLRARLYVPSVSDLMSLIPKPFAHYTKGAVFDGSIQLDADAKGQYHDKRYPVLNAHLQVEDLHGHFDGYSQSIDELDLDAFARYHQNDKNQTYAQLKRLYFKSTDSHLLASGKAEYRQRRPYLDAVLKGHLNLGSLNQLYEIHPGMDLRGILNADVNAYFFVDDLQEKRLNKVYSQGLITGDDLLVHLPDDSLRLFVDSLTARLNTNTGAVSRRNAEDTALVNLRVRFEELNLRFKHLIQANSSRFSLSLMADDIDADSPPKLRGSVSMRGLKGTALDSLMLDAAKMRASLSVSPDEDRAFLPRTTMRVSFDSIKLASPKMGMLLDSTRLKVSALPRYRRTRRVNGQRVTIPDSLQPVRNFKWMVDTLTTIAKSDSLVERYMNLFANDGDVYVKSFRARSQDFPLPIGIRRLDVAFSDDTLKLDNLQVRVGRSSAGFTGNVYNMRRYLMRNNRRPRSAAPQIQDPERAKRLEQLRTLVADLSMRSRRIDANQLVRAMYEFNQSAATQENTANEAAQNNLDLLAESASEAADSTAMADSLVSSSLIKIPDHMDLHFAANIDSVLISHMKMSDFRGDITVNNQTLRIKQLTTSTEVGDAQMNVMYHCDNDKDANAAIAVNLDSVQIGELVEALPELDSIMPMLRSFKGNVECELSATARLDSSMSIVLPSVNAAGWLQGQNLVLLDGETFSEIAKMLMFSKKTENVIDSIAVELLVRNNEIEIFPFVVSLDKYRVGVGGNQALDMSFKYHIAVLKSPLPFMLGVDVYGTDFDHIKFKLVSPKFKDTNVKIGRGGTLLRKEDANLRENFHRMIVNKILKD